MPALERLDACELRSVPDEGTHAVSRFVTGLPVSQLAAEVDRRGSLVEGPFATAFAQEVRRTAPCVPMLPGRAIADIELDGRRLRAGGRVVLDILGTDTGARSWPDAETFDPARFDGVVDYEALAAFVPHGGAEVAGGHRCPGEKLAIAGLAAAISALCDRHVRILGTGLDVNRRHLPTKPASGGPRARRRVNSALSVSLQVTGQARSVRSRWEHGVRTQLCALRETENP